MDLTRTGYGIWSGGRFMHFGEPLEDERFLDLIRLAYEKGIRTFMTADAYGAGQADEMLGKALAGFPRDREQWFRFRDERGREAIREWLDRNGIEPTTEPPERRAG